MGSISGQRNRDATGGRPENTRVVDMSSTDLEIIANIVLI